MRPFIVEYSEVIEHSVYLKAESAEEGAKAVLMQRRIPLEENPNIELIDNSAVDKTINRDNEYVIKVYDINEQTFEYVSIKGELVK